MLPMAASAGSTDMSVIAPPGNGCTRSLAKTSSGMTTSFVVASTVKKSTTVSGLPTTTETTPVPVPPIRSVARYVMCSIPMKPGPGVYTTDVSLALSTAAPNAGGCSSAAIRSASPVPVTSTSLARTSSVFDALSVATLKVSS